MDLYGAVVAQARQALFYTDCGIPDTPEGRYELIVLHLALVLDRLSATGKAGSDVSRALIERFVDDMDDNMREMGVGDLTVPKKVKKAAGGLHDRTQEYAAALRDSSNAALGKSLMANVPELADRPGAADALAGYVRAAAAILLETQDARVLAGAIAFPHPDRAVGPGGGA